MPAYLGQQQNTNNMYEIPDDNLKLQNTNNQTSGYGILPNGQQPTPQMAGGRPINSQTDPSQTIGGLMAMQAVNQPDINLDQQAKLARITQAGFLTSGAMNPVGTNDDAVLSKIDPSVMNESWVKGYLARKQLQRENADTNMALEKQAIARTAITKKQAIDQGMSDAARAGGYQGVINYLQIADPDRALQFTDAKNSLDQAMMKTDVMRMAMPNEQAKVLAEGYNIIGKMGYALLNAKPQDRAAMYKGILPILKTVNPDAPDTLNDDAIGMFMLGAAQATPENQLMSNTMTSNILKTDIGKTSQALYELNQKGLGNSQTALDLQDHLSALKNKDTQTGFNILNAQQKLSNANSGDPEANAKLNMAFTKQLKDASSEFDKNMDTMKSILTTIKVIDQNNPGSPNSAYAVGQLRMLATKMLNGGRPSDPDYEHAQAAGGWGTISKNVKSWFTGTQVALAPWEVAQVKEVMKSMVSDQYQSQLKLEQQYKNFADTWTHKDGKPIVNWSSIPLSSKTFEGFMNPNLSNQQNVGKIPAGAILYLQQHPDTIQMFQKTFPNVDAKQFLAPQSGAGQTPTGQ